MNHLKFYIFMMTASLLIATGCEDKNDKIVAVTAVELDKNVLTLQVTQIENLQATVFPADATDQTVTWSSSSDAVASVSQNGEVTAAKDGFAIITVTTTDGNKKATCTVTVVPESDNLNSYGDLKTYVDRSANPVFMLGAGVLLNDYVAKGDIYHLLTANFDQITLGNEMKHDAIVQNSGELRLENVSNLLAVAKTAGIAVYGHTLVWHAQQRADYLNSLIAPTISVQDNLLESNLIANSDFESNTNGWNSWGNNSMLGRTEEGDGYGGGYAMRFTNPTAVASWQAQVAYDFPTALQNGSRYLLNLHVKGTRTGAITVDMQNPDNYAVVGSFGVVNITEEWSEVTLMATITGANAKRFIFNCGEYNGTLFFDNVTVRRVKPGTSDSQLFIERTEEEKNEIMTAELERWIKGVMDVAGDYVKDWDLMNEPMSDWPDPYQLKTTPTSPTAGEFYWQDYLGKDVAVKAIRFARQYGAPDIKLFINDYGLEGDGQTKCKGLIAYVQYIESQGVKVDGIGTQMHISLDTRRENIVEMYKLLASTEKLIKITELDVGLGIIDKNHPVPWEAPVITTPLATQELYLEQADLYRFVVEKYFEHIPPAQRAGITVWSPFDSPPNSGWRANEPIGLWTLNHTRKPAYSGFANGLAGRDVAPRHCEE